MIKSNITQTKYQLLIKKSKDGKGKNIATIQKLPWNIATLRIIFTIILTITIQIEIVKY